MSDFTEVESMERVREGLKMAASAARDLERVQKNHGWGKLAFQFDQMLTNAESLYAQGPITRTMALNMLDENMLRAQGMLH